jgi:hypothetical protein
MNIALRRTGLAALLGAAALVASASAQTIPPIEGIRQEPVVVFDETGGTFAGPVHLHLTVYNSGQASIAETRWNDPDRSGSAAVTTLPPEAAKELFVALQAAGAGSLRDNPRMAADVPLKTVTFFTAPGTNSGTNSFSYRVAERPYAQVDAIFRRFICAHFPAFGQCGVVSND